MRDDNGGNGISSSQLNDWLDFAESEYAKAGITLVQCGNIRYHNSTQYNDFDYDAERIAAMNAYNVEGTLNIYICKRVGRGNSKFCGIANPPNSVSRRTGTGQCWSDKDCHQSTFVHEIGHTLSLKHTHDGGDELVDGSNCTTAGDDICDTPADPRLNGSLVNNACVYTGNLRDANNDLYAPEPRNIMSYTSPRSCRTLLTPDQRDRVLYSVINDYGGSSCPTNSCVVRRTGFPQNQNFETEFGDWNNVGDIPWLRRNSPTPSPNTGPGAAASGSHYLHTEGTDNENKVAELVSACYDLRNKASVRVKFSYHMYGSDMGTLRLDASVSGGSWGQIWSRSGDKGNDWLTADVNIGTAYRGKDNVRFRFRGTNGSGFRSDMAIDDIKVQAAAAAVNTIVKVRARTRGSNGSARLRLRKMAGSNHTGSNTIQETKTATPGTSWQVYTYTFSGTVPAERFRVYFDNDAGNRDLDVDYLEVNGTRFQSEAGDTYSKGSWTSSTGCSGGFKSSSTLHCNGYFHYDTNGNNADEGRSRDERAVNLGATAYPNPFRESVTVRLPAQGPAYNARVSMLTATGRRLGNFEQVPFGTSVEFRQALPAGVYFVLIQAGEEVQRLRVLKL